LADVFDVSVALTGVYMAILYIGSTTTMLFAGGFIRRYGAVRMSQVSLAGMASGLALGLVGEVWGLALGALVIGLSTAFSTPASSDILSRFAPPRHAPLIFSIKQTGVPLGGIIAGFLIPFLAEGHGWQAVFYVPVAICLTMALLMQPLRGLYDSNRDPNFQFRLDAGLKTLRAVVAPGPFRGLTLATFTFCGLQGVFGGFFVAFLVKGLDFSLVAAGAIFAWAQIAAIFGRIFWGWLAGMKPGARPVLATLGLAMGICSMILVLVTPGWTAFWVTVIALAYSATAISWHGVILAEISNLSQPRAVATNTGGVLAFATAGQIIYPAIFGALLSLTGGFGVGFVLAGVPAALIGVMFLRRQR
ncbi:MAG: MFS transporter, partial [Pseudomonadota bacterium]|nr:MFS transporter [Pseudomonadota bacterium]